MLFDEDLNESFSDLRQIEEELKRIDALYVSIKSQLPKSASNFDADNHPQSSILNKIIEEVKRNAAAEGRQRVALYEDKMRLKKGGTDASHSSLNLRHDGVTRLILC